MSQSISSKSFRRLRVRGAPGEIGWQHGSSLRQEIHRVLDYYRGLFGLPEDELLGWGRQFRDIIADFSADYAEEIEAIAAGAEQNPLLLYALNSRSEIFNNVAVAECTSVINTRESILAQNWDWAESLEPLLVDMTVERADGHRLRMLTEPGIIGKIGMNNAGLGVCLNILGWEQRLTGLPVHILLRAILDCSSLAEVEELLSGNSHGKASHILVGDRDVGCISVEFAGGNSFRLRPEDGLLLHTNHYLAAQSLNTAELFPSTHERIHRARSLLARDTSRSGIRAMLLDQSEAELSICRPYSPSEIPRFGTVGTVFTVLMDLRRGEMEIRAGSQGDKEFYRVSV